MEVNTNGGKSSVAGLDVDVEQARYELVQSGAIAKCQRLEEEYAQAKSLHGSVMVEFEKFDSGRDIVAHYRNNPYWRVIAYDIKKVNKPPVDAAEQYLQTSHTTGMGSPICAPSAAVDAVTTTGTRSRVAWGSTGYLGVEEEGELGGVFVVWFGVGFGSGVLLVHRACASTPGKLQLPPVPISPIPFTTSSPPSAERQETTARFDRFTSRCFPGPGPHRSGQNQPGLIGLNFLSPDGRSHSFDARANGYGRGEGVGIIVLNRLSDAIRDNDNVRAPVRTTRANRSENRHEVEGVDAQIYYFPEACVFVANFPEAKSDSALEAAITKAFLNFGSVFVEIRHRRAGILEYRRPVAAYKGLCFDRYTFMMLIRMGQQCASQSSATAMLSPQIRSVDDHAAVAQGSRGWRPENPTYNARQRGGRRGRGFWDAAEKFWGNNQILALPRDQCCPRSSSEGRPSTPRRKQAKDHLMRLPPSGHVYVDIKKRFVIDEKRLPGLLHLPQELKFLQHLPSIDPRQLKGPSAQLLPVVHLSRYRRRRSIFPSRIRYM
ncbi:Uu.00g111860.m01.CDS01, partial [Anthostomella pinea]